MQSEPEDEPSALARPVVPSQSIWDANDFVIAVHRARLRQSPAYEGWFWNGSIPLDDAARKGLVLRRVERWRLAVELQHERLTKAGDRDVVDIHFYVLAVDNLADAVKVLQSQYLELQAVQSAVQDALQRFVAAAPVIHDLRNLLEHFDEYDHMIGRLQKSNQLPKQRMGQVENYSLLDGDAQLVVFGKSMIVSKTTPAARPLLRHLSGIAAGFWPLSSSERTAICELCDRFGVV